MNRDPGSPQPHGRLSPRARTLGLVVFTTLLCVILALAAEMAVRIRATLKYGTTATAEDLYTTDDRIGLRVPYANLDVGRIRTNSLGFRGPEIVVPKPSGVIRIAFLGASTTWCAEVSSNEHAWPSLVVDRLRISEAGRQWDYVNGGVPGYTVDSLLKNLEYRVAPLEPDVIVIYEATNDLSGELRELAHRQGLLETATFKPLSWPSRYSLLWELAEKNLRIILAQREARRNAARLKLDVDRLGGRFREQLTGLVRTAQRHARVVAIATFSTQLRAGQSPEQQDKAAQSAMFYMPFMSPATLIQGYDRYNAIIREVASATGAVLIDDLERIPGTPEYFTDTVHFTDAGSRAMADRVSAALQGIAWQQVVAARPIQPP